MSEILILRMTPRPNDRESYDVSLLKPDGAVVCNSTPDNPMLLPETEVDRLEIILPTDEYPDASLLEEGEKLYERLPAIIRAKLEPFLNQYLLDRQRDPTQRVTVLINPVGQADSLWRIPWEIMLWPMPAMGGVQPMSIARTHHLSRILATEYSGQLPRALGPLRVLIAVGVNEDGLDGGVEAKKEELAIRRAIQPVQRTIDLEVCTPLVPEDLYAAIRTFRPHVFHFIGHGTNSPPTLVFQFGAWQANDIAQDLLNESKLDGWEFSLVFLNGCRSATPDGKYGSLASAFMRYANGVIAMQGDIQGELAGKLAGMFYRRISEGMAVNEALSDARGEVGGINGQNAKQGAYPALITYDLPVAVLPAFEKPGASYSDRVNDCVLLRELPSFVNQTQYRRNLYQHIWPLREKLKTCNFVIVRGGVGCGKSLLCAWLLDLALRVGHVVRYVGLGNQMGAVSCAKVIEMLWTYEAEPSSPLTDRLDGSPSLLQPSEGVEPVLDSEAFETIRGALEAAATEKPITIVIDQLGQKIDKGSFLMLWNYLFMPVRNNKLPRVRIVLSLSDEDIDFYGLDEPVVARAVELAQVKLAPLPRGEFVERLLEYVYFRDNAVNKPVFNIAQLLQQSVAAGAAALPVSYFGRLFDQYHEIAYTGMP